MCTIEENCSRDLLGTTRLITEFDSRYVIYPLTEETHEIKRLKRQETNLPYLCSIPTRNTLPDKMLNKIIHECFRYWEPGVLLIV